MQKVKLTITGMHCTSCAMNIDGELEDTDGVKESKTNYAKQMTEVTFDSQKITQGTIQTIIQKLGYETKV